MKNLLLIFTLFTYNLYSQSNCFSNKDDVMTYAIGKTFGDTKGKMELTFDYSQAQLIVLETSDKIDFVYEDFTYLGEGHKGLIKLIATNGVNWALDLAVSCKYQGMNDLKRGIHLFEKGTFTITDNNSNGSDVSINDINNFFEENYCGVEFREGHFFKDGRKVSIAYSSDMEWNFELYDDMCGSTQEILSKFGGSWRLATLEEIILAKNNNNLGILTKQYSKIDCLFNFSYRSQSPTLF